MKKLKITFNAPVTLGFALVSLVVLGLNILTRGRSNSLLFSTYHSSLLSPLTYLRFVTHVLGHSGWQHYAGNMMYILLLGPMLEELHFLPQYCPLRRQRCRVCVHSADFLHRIP